MSKPLRSDLYSAGLAVSPSAAGGRAATLGAFGPRNTLALVNNVQFWQKLGVLNTDWGTVVNNNRGRITGFDQVTLGALTVQIQPGRARNLNLNDSGTAAIRTSTTDIILPAAVIADLAASGVNGLDTGVVAANVWYFIYVIGDSRGINPAASLWSLSGLAPTMPAGYNRFRRIGSARTTAGALRPFRAQTFGQYRLVRFRHAESLRQVLVNGSSTNPASITISMSALSPPSIQPAGTTSVPSITWIQVRQDGTAEGRIFARGLTANGPTYTIRGGSNNQMNIPILNSGGTVNNISYNNDVAGGLLQIWQTGYDEPI